MLLIQNKRVNWETCQIGIASATTKDKENRRVPFNCPSVALCLVPRLRPALHFRTGLSRHALLKLLAHAARCRFALDLVVTITFVY